jgi:hypothetical protein
MRTRGHPSRRGEDAAPQDEVGDMEPVKKYGPHPEELAKQASRRMDATHGLAVILRDARKGALLRMRSEIYSQALRMRSERYSQPLRMRYFHPSW